MKCVQNMAEFAFEFPGPWKMTNLFLQIQNGIPAKGGQAQLDLFSTFDNRRKQNLTDQSTKLSQPVRFSVSSKFKLRNFE